MRAKQAWVDFGRRNGVATLRELTDVTQKYAKRHSRDFTNSDDPLIGCIVLSSPVFLPMEKWIDPGDAGITVPDNIEEFKYVEAEKLNLWIFLENLKY